jgi:acyl-CoA thioesterase YciA
MRGQRQRAREIRLYSFTAKRLSLALALSRVCAVKPSTRIAVLPVLLSDGGEELTIYSEPTRGEESMDDSRTQPKTRVLMMPRDTNPAGTIFGGVILSYIDQAGAEEARYQGAERVVTVAMKEVVFLRPVFVGDLVSFYTELVRVGRTSITVRVMVTAARQWDRAEDAQVTEAEITYVNIDANHQPTPLKPSTRLDSD